MKSNKLLAYDICHDVKMGKHLRFEMIEMIESMLDAGYSRFECQLRLQREINERKNKYKRVKTFGFGKHIKQERTSSVGDLQKCSSDQIIKELAKSGRNYSINENIKTYRNKISRRTKKEQKRIDWENRPIFISVPMGGLNKYHKK